MKSYERNKFIQLCCELGNNDVLLKTKRRPKASGRHGGGRDKDPMWWLVADKFHKFDESKSKEKVLPWIVKYCNSTSKDSSEASKFERLVKGAMGLLGDLAGRLFPAIPVGNAGTIKPYPLCPVLQSAEKSERRSYGASGECVSRCIAWCRQAR